MSNSGKRLRGKKEKFEVVHKKEVMTIKMMMMMMNLMITMTASIEIVKVKSSQASKYM